jgi:hypothetical protein
MRRLDIRTQTTSSQSGNGNQLPSVALDAKMISTPTYLFRCRGIYDHHDMAAAGNWNLHCRKLSAWACVRVFSSSCALLCCTA